jgi:hypothetical protein
MLIINACFQKEPLERHHFRTLKWSERKPLRRVGINVTSWLQMKNKQTLYYVNAWFQKEPLKRHNLVTLTLKWA